MNAVTMIDQQMQEKPREPALWLSHTGTCSFYELDQMAQKVAGALLKKGLKPGAEILLLLDLSPLLYATIIAMARLGMTAVLVEPWMPLDRLALVFASVRAEAFISNRLGQVWGLRVPAVRRIPHWLLGADLLRGKPDPCAALSLDPGHPCIVTYTSGTSGLPKGMVRSHAYLKAQHQALTEALHLDTHSGPDLCIFANFALANLASGRCSLIIAKNWQAKDFHKLNSLPNALQAVSTTCGPAFLREILKHAELKSLQAMHVGGAQTDCAIFERAFARWPNANFAHVYGSTEAEPVAVSDARDAVQKSRERGYFQTLYLGQPWAGLSHQKKAEQIWISGPHVCPEYRANPAANAAGKFVDADGKLWHRMGDRIECQASGWWYAGRDHLPAEDFADEQRLYSIVGHSKAFLHRNAKGELAIYSAHAQNELVSLKAVFPQIPKIFQTTIRRDLRHRARIDRDASLKGAKCLFDG
ncbi:MAG: AMP-binding protein [Proteobacteria bacterium]|nr:AMP-binding protein [Pseudomonadota bacterium]